MRYKKGNLNTAKLPTNVLRLIGVYIDAKSMEPSTDRIRDLMLRFPSNNIYEKTTRRHPGQIIYDPPLLYIVGQIIPRQDSFETSEDRLETFRTCMKQLVEILGDTGSVEIAIDRGLGEELHGNEDWNIYKEIMLEIETTHKHIEFLVYKSD